PSRSRLARGHGRAGWSPGGFTLSSRKELTAEARELKGELYCLPCHDKMGVPICGACRRPIEGRVVNALGKQWHVELFGDVCYTCSHVIEGDGKAPLSPNKFVEFDMKPVCKRCYEKFPLELKKRLKKLSELAARRAQPKSAGLQPA
ncbi:hypothetical protein E2I00_005158, partial [Balaenoptera physalus]